MSSTLGGLLLGSGTISTAVCGDPGGDRAEHLEADCSSRARSSLAGTSNGKGRLIVACPQNRHRVMAGGVAVAAYGRGAQPLTLLESLERFRIDGEVPAQYQLKEGDRPTVDYDEWSGSANIPVLDLSQAQSDRPALRKQMGDAAKEYGFFQIVNHGLSLEELKELQAHGFGFFELPAAMKSKYSGFAGDNSSVIGSSLHWAESLSFTKTSLDNLVSRVWPAGNERFRNAVLKFLAAAENMNRQILELLAESVGLETDFFSQHLNSRKTGFLRWNFYPACPQPSEVLGAGSHTDGCAITVLQQSSVGGLQILKDKKWIGIKPIEGALVINVGDVLHAWTNGIFKSVLHRAAVNKTVHRLSLAVFLSVDGQLPIYAPDELIDDEHPRLYRSFNFFEYGGQVLKLRQQGLVGGDGQLVLDRFRVGDGLPSTLIT